MTKLRRSMLVAFIATGLGSMLWGQTPQVQALTRQFLDAYASGDHVVVLRLIDQANVSMYGSDASEIVHGGDALLKLMDKDHQLWGNAAHMGAMQHVSIVQSGGLASIFFDVPFSIGDRAPTPVRVAAVWKREGKQWLLIQSSNTVATEHQSADD